jgi:hypothetical protein
VYHGDDFGEKLDKDVDFITWLEEVRTDGVNFAKR